MNSFFSEFVILYTVFILRNRNNNSINIKMICLLFFIYGFPWKAIIMNYYLPFIKEMTLRGYFSCLNTSRIPYFFLIEVRNTR